MLSFYLILSGLISGIIAGMGMGGGTLLIPILSIFFAFKQQLCQGINLLVFIPMSIVALIIHFKNKLINFKIGIPIMISGIITSIVGSFIATKLSSANLKIYFAIFLIIMGVLQTIETVVIILNKKKKNQQKLLKKEYKKSRKFRFKLIFKI